MIKYTFSIYFILLYWLNEVVKSEDALILMLLLLLAVFKAQSKEFL